MVRLPRTAIYWICQFSGWIFYASSLMFFAFVFESKIREVLLYRLLLQIVLGVVFTDILRNIILYFKIQVPLSIKKLFHLLIWVLILLTTMNLLNSILVEYFKWYEANSRINIFQRFLINSVFDSPTFIMWVSIYYFWHYFEWNKKKDLEDAHLKTALKELELHNIKTNINPHFIFNALNCIRALVDENPSSARIGITKLSSILRQSLQANSIELNTIDAELKIVNDYLDLEKIRFEDRLIIEQHIEKDIENYQIPVMMLQILVENAIKHGIDKQTEPSTIKISIIKENHFIILGIINKGIYEPNKDNQGFGLKSTKERLQLLYPNNAEFSIENLPSQEVLAQIKIPI